MLVQAIDLLIQVVHFFNFLLPQVEVLVPVLSVLGGQLVGSAELAANLFKLSVLVRVLARHHDQLLVQIFDFLLLPQNNILKPLILKCVE